MHQYLAEFLAIALIHLLAVASPGPDFAIVLKQSITYGRENGFYTSMGIGAGILIHVAYCVLGLGIIISQSIVAFNVVKYVGAAYLIYIGISALRAGPTKDLSVKKDGSLHAPTRWRSFYMGFITNALNPKATLFFLAVFSVTVSPKTPVLIQVGYGLYMAFAAAAWFALVTVFFSHTRVREAFQRMGHWFERSMGLILIGFGVKLALANLKR